LSPFVHVAVTRCPSNYMLAIVAIDRAVRR
jgi:hypothetical protein